LIINCLSCGQDQKTDLSNLLPDEIDFNFHVKPILSDRCYACHGPDEKTIEADLRLDLKENALNSTASNGSLNIVKGKPYQSELIKRIKSHDADYMMPPPDSELSLTELEKEILVKWIEQGAEWKDHWSFIPPIQVALPDVENEN